MNEKSTKKKGTKVKAVKKLKRKYDRSLYLNRELQWLEFNDRVLWQATDDTKPLLERLRFCDIFISNLDEFYMKRVGGLINQKESIHAFESIDGRTPSDQLNVIRSRVIEQQRELKRVVEDLLIPALKKENILLLKWKDLTPSEKVSMRSFFYENIFPILTPLAVDYVHPFPFISNLSKSLAIMLKTPNSGERIFARVKIPNKIPGWVIVSQKDQNYRLLNIDEMIVNNLDVLYSGMKVASTSMFRVTRHAGLEEDDGDSDDLMEHVEEGLKERKFSPVLRLELDKDTDPWLKKYLLDELYLQNEDVYEIECISNYAQFKEVIELVDRPDLKYPAWNPKTKQQLLDDNTSVFSVIKRRDILIHHPYENFSTSVERFIQSAALDPMVLAIKLTLYRTDKNSQIIRSLIRAAEKGKQVACVVELKARFDEESNIRWAEKLENAGVHVVYGVSGLKTHSKMAMVVRSESGTLRAYVHLGTGNYNSTTSRVYTDLSLLSTRKSLTKEVMEVFNYLTGYSLNKDYKKLLVAPINMKKKFLSLIHQEIQNKLQNKPALIVAKMNQLEDIDIIEKLYEASIAGVRIKLFVRGFCCLRPGVKNLSENIEVISIIGRFLEHSRIFYFANGSKAPEDGRFFIGSADWMYRNLQSRVEVITPIESVDLKTQLWDLLHACELDNVNSWQMHPSGKYKKRSNSGKRYDSHSILMHKSNEENDYYRG